jgi:hypothetical protein
MTTEVRLLYRKEGGLAGANGLFGTAYRLFDLDYHVGKNGINARNHLLQSLCMTYSKTSIWREDDKRLTISKLMNFKTRCVNPSIL